MRVVLECAREVPILFRALNDGDKECLAAVRDRIFEKENEADKIKNELRTHLPKSLFMPVDRRDLLEVLQMQDTIADRAQDIAGLLQERPMELPESLREPMLSYVNRCVDTCAQATEVIEKLEELVETGFRGRQMKKVEAMVNTLNTMESETDEMGQEIISTLFKLEDDMNPISVMMWYRIIEWIGDLADYAEKVGDRLRLIIAQA
jgi:predicted phosphate transport protein (TIGR00153 family)